MGKLMTREAVAHDLRLVAALDALDEAESFIAGFEGDELQEGVDELLERIRALTAGQRVPAPQVKPVRLSECCHAPIFYDAWVDSNDELAGGPFDNCICGNCSMEEPGEWDGRSPAWPREEREGGADLPEGVEEPAEPCRHHKDTGRGVCGYCGVSL